MSIPSVIDENKSAVEEINGIFGYREFQADSDEQYNAIYVEIDTDPRVNHRIHPDHLQHSYVVFDEPGRKSKVVKFNRQKRIIEWLVGAQPIVDGTLKKVLEAEMRASNY